MRLKTELEQEGFHIDPRSWVRSLFALTNPCRARPDTIVPLSFFRVRNQGVALKQLYWPIQAESILLYVGS
jgi:hypothetical protein